MKITRRDFLKMGGGVGLALAAGGGLWNCTRPASIDDLNEPGVEQWVPTVCGQCLGGCGILVRVIDGWAVNIAGNPVHPVNRGALCSKGIAGLQGLYDPDRIRTPLKRSGKRGEDRWQPISWDEALQMVAAPLKELRQSGQAHRLVFLGGGFRGMMRSLWERFLESFGSPNYVDSQFAWEDLPMEGLFLTQGIRAVPAYDLERSAYILSLGSDLLESFWSPVQALSAYGQFRRGRPEHRGRLVQIEPRLSITGMKADEWIPTRPGTEAMVALGIANMMIREGLYNKDFVSQRCFGFENWTDAGGKQHPGFKEFVLAEYEPNVVSKATGVPTETLIRLAREFASNPPSLALGYRDRPFHQMAVSVLNGLTGNISSPGGVLIPAAVPLQALPPVKKDPAAQKGLEMERIDGGTLSSMALHRPYAFASNVTSGKPYEPKVLFLYYTNPLFSNPSPELFSRAFDKIPLIVSFSPYLDDSTRMADLILPDHTPLERWQDDPVFLNSGPSVLGLRQPAVPPVYQTRATGDVLLQLAKAVGGEVEKAFPWNDFKEVLLHGIRGVFDARRGDIFGLQFDQAWTRLLERGGWWAPSYKTFDDFWKLLQEKGGWWDPLYQNQQWERSVMTRSRKFEFFSQGRFDLSAPPSGRSKDSASLPHWEEPEMTGDPKAYPFHLHIFRTAALAGSRNANQPWLQAIAGTYLSERWETWAELNPETARQLGISDRDGIWVESPHGKIRVRARIYHGAMPEVVNIPFGFGHSSGGRWSAGRGENPYRLLPAALDPMTGHPVRVSTRVKVYKA